MTPAAPAIVARPEVAALLKEAIDPLLKMLPLLDSEVSAPCASCNMRRQRNRQENHAAVEIGATINKLQRWAEAMERGVSIKDVQ